MNSFRKIRQTLVSSLLVLGLTVLLVAPVLADGTLIRSFDVPTFAKKAFYWPIGVASDGKNLWYSQPATNPPGIFQITTTGVLLQSLSVPLTSIGAIAWDGANLWLGNFGGPGGALIFQVSVGPTPTVLKTLNLTSILAPDVGNCNVIDGLDFDASTGSLWVSPDIGCNPNFACVGFAYQVDTSGNLVRRIQTPFAISGVAAVGRHLYAADRCNLNIDELDLKGNVLSKFPISRFEIGMWIEDLAFDPATFAPTCALWAMQPYTGTGPAVDHAALAAYNIGCP